MFKRDKNTESAVQSMPTKDNLMKSLRVASTIWEKYNYIIIFISMFILYMCVSPNINWPMIMNILLHSSVQGVIALGMGLVIINGDIDLSVGSTLALVGGLIILVFNATGSIILTFISAIVFGALCGFFNGILIGKAKMPAFIVTLATMLIFRSMSQFIMDELNLTYYALDARLGEYLNFIGFGNDRLLTIPIIGIMFLIVAGALIYVTTSTKFGKRIYAIGSNPKAARLAGINVEWTKVIIYVILGALIGFATFLQVANVGSIAPSNTGKNFELYAIAGVVIGGISMSGGKGKIAGVIFGIMSFVLIDKIIISLEMNPMINDTIKGAILLIAIVFQMIKRKGK